MTFSSKLATLALAFCQFFGRSLCYETVVIDLSVVPDIPGPSSPPLEPGVYSFEGANFLRNESWVIKYSKHYGQVVWQHDEPSSSPKLPRAGPDIGGSLLFHAQSGGCASRQQLNAIGANICNVNTVGFKSSGTQNNVFITMQDTVKDQQGQATRALVDLHFPANPGNECNSANKVTTAEVEEMVCLMLQQREQTARLGVVARYLLSQLP